MDDLDMIATYGMEMFPSDAESTETEHRILLGRELSAVRRIKSDSENSRTLGRSEEAWMACVHMPLLRLALDGGDRTVVIEVVTGERIVKRWLPSEGSLGAKTDDSTSTPVLDGSDGVGAGTVGTDPNLGKVDSIGKADLNLGKMVHSNLGKMVDLVLVLDPSESTRLPRLAPRPAVATDVAPRFLANGIHQLVCGYPWDSDLRSINQTEYEPLRYCPAAINIKTQASGSDPEGGRLQLGACISASHARIGALLEDKGKALESGIITMPAIVVVDE